MCKVGGPRCSGSHTATPRQQARRKANTQYRNAVSETILNITGSEDLARRVKSAPVTDLHDVVQAAGLDADAIAGRCEPVTYDNGDGTTATAEVTPAGTVRRTPVTDETLELIEDIDDAMQVLPGGPYRNAVLSGERDAAEKIRAGGNERIARVVDEAKSLDVENATDSELNDMLHQLNTLDNYSQATRGYGFDLDDDEDALAAHESLEAERQRREAREYAPEYTYRENYGFDEVTPDNRDAVADAVAKDISSRDLYEMDPRELAQLTGTLTQLDRRVQQAGGAPLPEAEQVFGVFEDLSKEDIAVKRYEEEQRKAREAEKDDRISPADITADNAHIAAADAMMELNDTDFIAMGNDEFEAFFTRVEDTDTALKDAGHHEGVAGFGSLQVERNLRSRGTEDGRDPEPSTYEPAVSPDIDDIYNGVTDVTEDNADDVYDAISDEITGKDISGLSDEEFDDFYERVGSIDDKLRAAGHDGVYELAALADERDYRNQDDDEKYEFGDEYQRHNQLTQWSYDYGKDVRPDGVDADMWRAAQYLTDSDRYAYTGRPASEWADGVLADPDEHDAFTVGVAQNVADKKLINDISTAIKHVDNVSDAMLDNHVERMEELRVRMDDGDSPMLSGNHISSLTVGELMTALYSEQEKRDNR